MKRDRNLYKFLILLNITNMNLVNLQKNKDKIIVVSPILELVLMLCKNLHKIKLVLNKFYYLVRNKKNRVVLSGSLRKTFPSPGVDPIHSYTYHLLGIKYVKLILRHRNITNKHCLVPMNILPYLGYSKNGNYNTKGKGRRKGPMCPNSPSSDKILRKQRDALPGHTPETHPSA